MKKLSGLLLFYKNIYFTIDNMNNSLKYRKDKYRVKIGILSLPLLLLTVDMIIFSSSCLLSQ